jgi:hypothetical protein
MSATEVNLQSQGAAVEMFAGWDQGIRSMNANTSYKPWLFTDAEEASQAQSATQEFTQPYGWWEEEDNDNFSDDESQVDVEEQSDEDDDSLKSQDEDDRSVTELKQTATDTQELLSQEYLRQDMTDATSGAESAASNAIPVKRPIRCVSWNIACEYNEDALLEMTVVNNIHFLSCQEILPNIGAGEQMTRITGGQAKVQQHGYEALYSKHQILLVDQERMQYAEVEPAKVMNDGRVIVTRFRTEALNEQGVTVQGPELTMISCYCVSRSSTVKYADGTDRRELLQTVENAVVSEVNAAVARDIRGYVVVMGDLQEQFDGRFLKELKEAGMVSPMMNRAKEATMGWTELQKVKGMPTRYPRKGMKGDPTAIDWILVISHMLPLVDCFSMDNELNRIYIGSDHIPLFVDFEHSSRGVQDGRHQV